MTGRDAVFEQKLFLMSCRLVKGPAFIAGRDAGVFELVQTVSNLVPRPPPRFYLTAVQDKIWEEAWE